MKTARRSVKKRASKCPATVFVNQFTDGILDPGKPMLGPVRDGGHIVANTVPGCWGPMITPEIKGGHEVTRPVAVEGAEPGDAVVIRIKNITVTSLAAASGNDTVVSADRFVGDPYVARRCPHCDTMHPKTIVKGIGRKAVRCAACGEEISPFTFTSGYTMVFDGNYTLGLTLDRKGAEKSPVRPATFHRFPNIPYSTRSSRSLPTTWWGLSPVFGPSWDSWGPPLPFPSRTPTMRGISGLS